MENSASRTLPPVFFTTVAVEEVQATTDAGRLIPLLRYEAVAILPQGERLTFQDEQQQRNFLNAIEQKFLENTSQDPKKLVKLVDAYPLSNCNGWIFTGGQYGVCDTLALSILEDNGYLPTPDAQHGDLVLFTKSGQVMHSGIVRIDPSGSLLVESKWGPFGVYLHGIDSHPFPKTYTLYRSPRHGHALTMVPKKSVHSSA